MINIFYQEPKFLRKNLTNSVNEIYFLGHDGAHIRLMPENNLWKSGLKKQCPVLIVLDSKLDFGPWLSKFGEKKFFSHLFLMESVEFSLKLS